MMRTLTSSAKARTRRFDDSIKPPLNARMLSRHMREHCRISENCHSMMKHAHAFDSRSHCGE
jgi:hypothetical protein